MAVYTSIDREQVIDFLENYDLGTLESFEGIEQGVSNTNYHLYTSTGHYILTLFEPWRVDPSHVPFFLSYATHLQESGIPSARSIKDSKGALAGILEDRPAVIVDFLEGRHLASSEITPALCAQVGAMAARMHVAGGGFEQVSANSYGQDCWARWIETMNEGLIDISFGLYDAMKGELVELQNNWPENLPIGAIHADLFPDNVFFDGEQLSGVIDFHFACTDFFAYGLAIIVNAWCFDEDIVFVKERYEALLQGYEEERPLTNAEKAGFPVLLRAAALRFILSRCEETLSYKPGDKVVPHDPRAFIKRLEYFQNEF